MKPKLSFCLHTFRAARLLTQSPYKASTDVLAGDTLAIATLDNVWRVSLEVRGLCRWQTADLDPTL